MSKITERGYWPWIVALVIGVPVAYLASFGPACWWFTSRDPTGYGERYMRVHRMYWPIGWLAENGPGPVGDAIFWCANPLRKETVILPSGYSAGMWYHSDSHALHRYFE